MNLAGALVAPVFYNLNVCDMKEKGRGQRICTPVSVNQWFHTFLASGKCTSCDKFGIVNNTSHLFPLQMKVKAHQVTTLTFNLAVKMSAVVILIQKRKMKMSHCNHRKDL